MTDQLTVPDDTKLELLQQALDAAQEAIDAGDHPFGSALVTKHGTVVERNRVESTVDPTAHSEVMAIREAAKKWGNEVVQGSVLVTSNQPCPMCFCACLMAGVGQIVLSVPRTAEDPHLEGYTGEKLMDAVGAEERPEILEGYLEEQTQKFYAALA